jgi:solute carrier family 26 protein
VVALKGMFMQVYDLPKFASRSKLDGFLWVASFLAVIIMDIDFGLVSISFTSS